MITRAVHSTGQGRVQVCVSTAPIGRRTLGWLGRWAAYVALVWGPKPTVIRRR